MFSPTAAARAADTTFWIEPCTVMLAGCDAGDADLARWALEAWETPSGGQLHFVETKDRNERPAPGASGPTKTAASTAKPCPIDVNGRRGSECIS